MHDNAANMSKAFQAAELKEYWLHSLSYITIFDQQPVSDGTASSCCQLADHFKHLTVAVVAVVSVSVHSLKLPVYVNINN